MSSAIERFRNKNLLPKTVDVPWPINNPEITFHVAPFSQSEKQGAAWAAEKEMAERGVAKPNPDDALAVEAYEKEHQAHLFAALADVVKRHVKGWTHKPSDGEPLRYSPADLELLFKEFTFSDKMLIGASYSVVMLEYEKKKEDKAPNTPQDSSSA